MNDGEFPDSSGDKDTESTSEFRHDEDEEQAECHRDSYNLADYVAIDTHHFDDKAKEGEMNALY